MTEEWILQKFDEWWREEGRKSTLCIFDSTYKLCEFVWKEASRNLVDIKDLDGE